MDAAELHQSILRAFSSAPQPNRENIAPHQCLECDELATDFSGYDAVDLPNEIFQKHVWDMPLLSADAKHFYLPAWLIRGLDVEEPWLSDECASVLFNLDSHDHRWDSSPPYTQEQWRVIREWITHIEKFADSVDLECLKKATQRVDNELGPFGQG